MVTALPKAIQAPIHTARVIADCRRTAEAHRTLALKLGADVPTTAVIDEVRGVLSSDVALRLAEMRGQQEAARRWRELAHRLFSSA